MPICDAGVIRWNGGRISPLVHPALFSTIYMGVDRWFVVVAERSSQSPVKVATQIDCSASNEDYQRALHGALDYRFDFLVIEIRKSADGRAIVHIVSGPLGLAPVYFTTDDKQFNLSWNPATIIRKSPSREINRQLIARRLAKKSIYSTKTMFASVNMLTERSELEIVDGVVFFRYPRPISLRPPNASSRDQSLEEFADILRYVIEARDYSLQKIGVELSGGVDSACVAAALAKSFGDRIESFAVIFSGEMGEAQGQRRRALNAHLGCVDHVTRAEASPPRFFAKCSSEVLENFYGEYYFEAFVSLWDKAVERGCRIMASGHGGDELFPLYSTEDNDRYEKLLAYAPEFREARKALTEDALDGAEAEFGDQAPDGYLQDSDLFANIVHAPHLLQRGLWPLRPLADPVLAQYCRQLNYSERHNKKLARNYLSSKIGTGLYHEDYQRETFEPLSRLAFAEEAQAAIRVMKDSFLVDNGILDGDVVIEQITQFIDDPKNAVFGHLVDIGRVEQFFRAHS